jgi:hypothetical protein
LRAQAFLQRSLEGSDILFRYQVRRDGLRPLKRRDQADNLGAFLLQLGRAVPNQIRVLDETFLDRVKQPADLRFSLPESLA